MKPTLPLSALRSASRRKERVSGTLALAAVLAVAGMFAPARATAVTATPADIAVYGEQPSTFRDDVTPFPPSGSIFDYRFEANDPTTRLEFTAVPGFKNGRGRFMWRNATIGKYVMVGNAQTNGLGGTSTDLRIGVFDSETKQFCNLIIHPSAPLHAPQLVAGNPRARQSRIFFAPGSRPEFAGAAFGYVAADLDNPSPCTWPATVVSASQLNAGFDPADQICAKNPCVFDSVAMLGHEDVPGDPFGRDYVLLGEYFGPRNAVVRIDGTGIAVVATYNVPMLTIPNVGGECYSGGAARIPATDFRLPDTRPPDDWRFFVSYDAFPVDVYPSTPPPECAPPYPYCPRDTGPDGALGAACPGTGTCAQAYCGRPFFGSYLPCSSDAQCNGFLGDLRPCTSACLPKSSIYTCKTPDGGGSHRQCLKGQASTCPIAGETCSSTGGPPVTGPSQEYRFDKTTNTITTTSPRFLSTFTLGADGPTPTMAVYDSDRSIWVQAEGNAAGVYRTKTSSDTCTVGTDTNVHVPTGEHCFFDTDDPGMAVVVPPDQTLTFEQQPVFPYLQMTSQVGSAMYMADTGSLQYSQQFLGWWFQPPFPATYKLGFAYLPASFPITHSLASSSLPAEPKRCSVSLLGCDTSADCAPAGGTCTALPENALVMLDGVKFLEAGGAPRSLWVASGYSPTAKQPGGTTPPVPQTHAFLVRLPVGFNLDDNISAVRPAVAWSGTRLWLVAEHDGQLQYRVRDAGVWSGWYSLAPHNITPAGGPAVIANASSVFVFARSTAGVVHVKGLSSAQTCAPGSCTWGDWSSLPATVTTSDDIAATFAGPLPMVAIRHAGNEGIYATIFGFGWLPWARIDNALTSGAAPAVSYHAADGRAWIAARRKSDGQLVSSRIDPLTFVYDPWAALPSAGGPVSSGAPGLVSDGTKVRVFTFAQTFPNHTWQIANDGSGWSAWRKLVSGAGSTRQPAPVSINGDVDLLTNWFTNGIQETFVP
jgi:hypothetical protein